MHSSTAISSARSSMASATRCSNFLRIVAGMSRQALNASAAAVAARSISSALPRATDASTAPSTGEFVSNVSPEIDATILPSIMCPMPSALSCFSSGAARSRLTLNTSDAFGITLSMRGLRFQKVVDIVALPAGFLVVDLHVERQRELAARKDRVEIGGQRLEDMFAGLLSGRTIPALAQPQHHVEKAEIRRTDGDGVLPEAYRADANAAQRDA